MILRMEAGGELRLQSRLEVERALATLGTSGNGFATLVRVSGGFLQAAGTDAEGFVAEYREDPPDGPHWQSTRKDISRPEVIDLFMSYFDGTGAWKRSVEWRRLDDPDRGDRNTPAWSPLLLLVVGAALLCAAAHAGYRAQDVSTHLGHVRGELVSSRDCGKGHVCITVEYSVDGSTHVIDAKVSKGMLRSLRSERPVVSFDARNPRVACVGGPECVWYLFQGLGGIGGLLVIASGASYLRRKWVTHFSQAKMASMKRSDRGGRASSPRSRSSGRCRRSTRAPRSRT